MPEGVGFHLPVPPGKESACANMEGPAVHTHLERPQIFTLPRAQSRGAVLASLRLTPNKKHVALASLPHWEPIGGASGPCPEGTVGTESPQTAL